MLQEKTLDGSKAGPAPLCGWVDQSTFLEERPCSNEQESALECCWPLAAH
jgi:hypothetical protein